MAYFKDLMAFPVFFPQEEKDVKKYGDKQSVKLDQISFTVNKTATTAYNLYQSNKIDVLGSNLTKQFKGKKNYYSLSNGGTYYLELNEKNPNLANSNIRKAISLAINRENLIRILGGNNQVANTYTAKGLTEYYGENYTSMISSSAKDLYKYQPSKALQSMLETQLPGLKLTVTSVPFKTRLARRENGQFQICGSDWIADFGDPISFLELLSSKNSSNYGSWKNSQYDKLIAASKNTNDQEKRLKDMSKAESILLDDVGVYYEDDAWLIRSNAKGWICKRSEWNFKEAYVTK